MLQSLNISFDNLFIGDFNAVAFSFMGIAIVFAGLTLISLYIAVLPKILAFIEKDRSKPAAATTMVNAEPREAEQSDEDLMVAVAVALHMDQSFSEQNQKYTWDENSPADRSWKATMHGEVLASRQNLPLRRL